MRDQDKIAIYPGSFDPITFGHIDIIKRASLLFGTVIVSVTKNSSKSPLFTEKERMQMISESVQGIDGVKVDSFSGLLVDYAEQMKANVIIRGLRAVSDFEYEFQMALVNRKLNDKVVTVFLMTHDKYSYLNSTIVKELARLNGEIDFFVPKHVGVQLKEKLRSE